MSHTIRERGKKVFKAVKETSCQGIAAIASATEMSKSSVHRHQQAINRRTQYPESEFWESEAGSPPSALATLKEQLKETIRAYEAAQAEHCHPREGQGIGVGSDEVFFGLPVLVLMELGSGYIFTEVQSEDRTYETWKDQIQP